MDCFSLLETETKKKAGLCLAYSTHATGFLVFLLLLKSLAAAAAAAAACIPRSIFEIDLFMFWNLGENGEKLKDLSLD
ncbi:hypothetical protein CXB51_036319 [Gossypium anomalum]|uniref:Uncharacterized protein n=1 Tax=Gossypium anomalum TaxID=47600 RepID=A0A8J5Y0J1_9ROSI|nr:hypothetical protein CXB51_036319 [Gossypium anomalum]